LCLSAQACRLIEIFGLPDDYLPQTRKSLPPIETIDPDYKLEYGVDSIEIIYN
jgi:hypothetical protein